MIERKSIEQIVVEATDEIIRSRRGWDLTGCISAAVIFDSVSKFDNTPTCGLKAEDIFDEMFPGAFSPIITAGDYKIGIVYELLATHVKSIAEKRRCAISALLVKREQDKLNRKILEDIGLRHPDTDTDCDFGWDFPGYRPAMFDENLCCTNATVGSVTNDIVRRMNMDSSSLKMPKPKKMWSGYGRKGFSVTVEWEDGTKTTVTNPNETVTEFTGFCACVAKKIFGSTTKMMKAMEDAQTESKREFMQREHARKMEKEAKACYQVMKKRKHAARVQERLEELRIEREAEAIIAKEASANDE